MKTIYKYPLFVTRTQDVRLPIGADILTIQVQNELPYIWALVDPMAEKESVTIEIFRTGEQINFDMGADRVYISTFQVIDGTLVFHAFKYTGL